jgi:hypothetical protein
MRWDVLNKRINVYAEEVKSTSLLKELIAAQKNASKASKQARELFDRYVKTLGDD